MHSLKQYVDIYMLEYYGVCKYDKPQNADSLKILIFPFVNNDAIIKSKDNNNLTLQHLLHTKHIWLQQITTTTNLKF